MSDASTPAPGAPTPPAPGPAAPPAPGYAASAHPAPPAGPQVPPYARGGYAQQPYPGAPPVWTAPPAPGASRILAGLALGFAIFGALAALIPFGLVFAWLPLAAGIVLAIIALVRRAAGRGMSIAALIVSGVAIAIAALWGVGFALLGSWADGFTPSIPDDGEDEYYADDTYPVLGVEGLTGGTSRTDALPYGTPITVVDESTGEEVWRITVQAPVDATAAGGEEPPLNGAYLAVPVKLENLTDEAIYVSDEYDYAPYAWLLTGDGGRAEPTYLPGPPKYPQVWDLEAIEPGDTDEYYESFDVAASVTGTGYFVLDLDSGDQVFWGPAAG